MLTFSWNWTKLSSLMSGKTKFVFVLLGMLALQSCYTLVYPPKTLPESITTIVSEPAMASSLGSSSMYGWDPYWEPVLPYTNYHRGYGASYYDPYNYYDYHHHYYTPVYVEGEDVIPVAARKFDREDRQGSTRVRESRNSTSSQPHSTSSEVLTSSAPASKPEKSAPAISRPIKTSVKSKSVKSEPSKRKTQSEVKPVTRTKTKSEPKSPPPKKSPSKKDKQSSENSSRTRTKK